MLNFTAEGSRLWVCRFLHSRAPALDNSIAHMYNSHGQPRKAQHSLIRALGCSRKPKFPTFKSYINRLKLSPGSYHQYIFKKKAKPQQGRPFASRNP